MGKTRAELAYERVRLTERIAAQRALLARDLAPLRSLQRVGARASGLLAQVLAAMRQYPLVPVLLLGGFVLLRPRKAWRWGQRGLLLWRSWRALQQWQPATLWALLRRFV